MSFLMDVRRRCWRGRMNQSLSTLNPILLHSTCSVLWRNSLEIVNVLSGRGEAQEARKNQAEEPVQEEARALASVKQNVCLSDDMTAEWKNLPAGGKMEKFKLVESLRERANTAGYDQTRWIAVDSRYYPSWNPVPHLANSNSTHPGGSCAAETPREAPHTHSLKIFENCPCKDEREPWGRTWRPRRRHDECINRSDQDTWRV